MKRIALVAGVGVVLIGAALFAVSSQSADADRIVLRDTDPDIVALGAVVYQETAPPVMERTWKVSRIGVRPVRTDGFRPRRMMKPDIRGIMTVTPCFA